MSDKIDTAVRSVKAMNTEIVQWENRLQFVQDEVKRLNQTRDTLQAEIERKTADYNVYMAQRDSETKKIRQDSMDSAAQLAMDKAEFQGILQQFQKDRAAFEHEKMGVDSEKSKVQGQKDSIRGFITAVQRAMSLLDL